MSLLTWVRQRWDDIGDGLQNIGDAFAEGFEDAVGRVANAIELNFDNGAQPAGEDPARIYEYFHSGADTTSYQEARTTAQELSRSMHQHRADLDTACEALRHGWHGSAADAAHTAIAPLLQRCQAVAQSTGMGGTALGDQVGSFAETKTRVVRVPAQPPKGGGLAALGGVTEMVHAIPAAMAVAEYRDGTHTNQLAYSGYSAMTVPQSASLPTAEPVKSRHRPDTHVFIPGRTGPEHGGPGQVEPGGSWRPSPAPGGASPVRPPPHRHDRLFHASTEAPARRPAEHPGPGHPTKDTDPATASGAVSTPDGTTSAAFTGATPGREVSAAGPSIAGSALAGSAVAPVVPVLPLSGAIPPEGVEPESPRAALPEDGARLGAGGAGAATAARAAAASMPGPTRSGGVPNGPATALGAGRGDEDKEHHTPAYLVREHGGELVGDLGEVPPPVLGT